MLEAYRHKSFRRYTNKDLVNKLFLALLGHNLYSANAYVRVQSFMWEDSYMIPLILMI